MIIKGSQRGNAADLALHLMNAHDNERVEVAAVEGTIADDLYGAFAEFEAIAAGTRATQPLYSLSINPSARLSREQYAEMIDHIEQRLGLAGQPRAVVFHVKGSREHCHVVWSRIDVENMRAIHMAHDRRRLCDISCEMARKYGLELPQGLLDWERRQFRDKERLEPTLAENAYTKQHGITPEQRQAEITAAYERSDSAAAFRAALEHKGYLLAQGERRGFVVVDQFGHVHSLTRYIKGHTAKQIKTRLAPLTPEQLPSVDQARENIAGRARQQQDARSDRARELVEKGREKARAALAAKQAERRLGITQQEQQLFLRQAEERLALHAAQQREQRRLFFRVRSAVADLIGRTPGLRSVLGPLQKLTHLDPKARHALEHDAVKRRHEREKLDFERHKRALARLEARENQALENALRRTAEMARRVEHKAVHDFFDAAKERRPVRKDGFKRLELSTTFNDAAEFVEGADRDGEEDEAQEVRARAEELYQAQRRCTRNRKRRRRRDPD